MMDTGTIIALIGSCITTIGAAATAVAVLVKMRREIDVGNVKTQSIADDVRGIKDDMRNLQGTVSNMRVEFADLSATVKAHFGAQK